MLELKNLDCVRGSRTLFRNLDLSVSPGTLVQLEGPNGSGKTSLLRIICGLMEPAKGEVRWNGSNIRRLGEEYSQAIAYLGHRNGIKEELTALENLTIAGGLSGTNLRAKEANEALRLVGLEGRQNLPVRFLSEGQRRRTAVARLVTRPASLWLLDEVFAALDTTAVSLVRTLVEEHLNNGGMAIIATHHELNISAGSFQRLELAL